MGAPSTRLPGLRPSTLARLEVAANPLERIPGSPLVDFVARPVPAGIVGGGVRADAVGDRLDQGRTVPVRARPTASGAARYTAERSLPSTSTPGMP